MPRDPSGNYTLPALGNPAVTNTPITIAWWNGTSSDLASAMTDSLSRTGSGGMLGPFGAVDGTAGAPGLTFQSETTSGLYRATGGEIDVTIGGTRISRWTAANYFQVTQDNGSTWLTPVFQNKSATLTGAGGGLGLTVGSTAANIDVEKINGYVDLSGATNPASTTGFANRVTPKNVAKAWALLRTNGAGTVTVLDGFNIASVSLGITAATITFATAMTSNLYSAVGSAHASQALAYLPSVKNVATLQFQVFALAAPGTPLNPQTTAFDLDLVVYGVQ